MTAPMEAPPLDLPSHFTSEDGRRLAYTDSHGAGPAVLCLAGLSRNHRDFAPLVAALGRRFRMICLDSRGRGGSDWAEDPIAEYSVPVETRDALALVAHLGLKRVAIVGTSRGGLIGMAIAGGVKGLVSALVLNDVGAVVEGAGLLRIMSYLGREPTAPSFAEAGRDLMKKEGAHFPGVPLARWIQHAHALYRDDRGHPRLSYDPHLATAVAASIEGDIGRVSVWPLFDATHAVPVLCVRGENSDILRADTVAEMQAHHPLMSNVTVPDRGHAPFLDEPSALAAIEVFLEKHGS